MPSEFSLVFLSYYECCVLGVEGSLAQQYLPFVIDIIIKVAKSSRLLWKKNLKSVLRLQFSTLSMLNRFWEAHLKVKDPSCFNSSWEKKSEKNITLL